MALAFLGARTPSTVLLVPPAQGASAMPATPATLAQPQGCRTGVFATSALAATTSATFAAAARQKRLRRVRPARGAAGGSQGRMEVSPEQLEAVTKELQSQATTVAAPGPRSLLPSRAIPFLPEPAYRRYVRNVPGDAGFDPLGLAGETPEDFVNMLEAELKHGRIAMLAGVGFVAPELLHSRLADFLGLPDLMADYGCAPTLLNGGLMDDPVLMGSLVVIFGLMGFVDITIPRNTGLPGYYGWDPLNFGDVKFSEFARSLLQNDTEWVAEAEMKHGRIAMIAVTFMALREYITEEPIWPSL